MDAVEGEEGMGIKNYMKREGGKSDRL